MHMLSVSYHFIVDFVGDHPFAKFALRVVLLDELLAKLFTMFVYEVVRSLTELQHATEMELSFFMLEKCILVFALLTAHFAVVFVFS